jgi:hypothetical protein
MFKNTKKKASKPNKQIRVRISGDHYDVLKMMEASTGLNFPALAAAAFRQGVPQIQKRLLVDAERN